MKVIAPKLFDPRYEKEKFVGIRLEFDTTSLKSKDRSLLQELEDDVGLEGSRQQSMQMESGDIMAHEESENFDHSEEVEAIRANQGKIMQKHRYLYGKQNFEK